MKKWIMFSCISLIGISSFALDKQFSCKNIDGLPDNTYKFTATTLAPNIDLPFIEATRYFREIAGDTKSRAVEYKLKGFGLVSTSDGNLVIVLGGLRFEFDHDELTNCKK